MAAAIVRELYTVTKFKNTDLLWVQPDFNVSKGEINPTDSPKQKPSGKNKTATARPPHADYTVNQLAEEWGLSPEKIRELFRNEPGVIKLQDPDASKKRKRRYTTLRIPVEVAQRVRRRLS